MTASKHINRTFPIIDTIHIVVLIVVIQGTGYRHDEFSNGYWYNRFLLFDLREGSCIHSEMFHNCSVLLVKLAVLEAVDLSLLQFSILNYP